MKTPSHPVLVYLRSLVHRHADAASDDRELLRRFDERRDEAAFAVLLQRHGPMVLSAARRLTGDEHLAEDVFQATFLLLARKANTIRGAEALPCWLHSVARRLAMQARRAHVRRREQEAQVRPLSSADPLEEMSARELVAVLDAEIGKLPESQRSALILCCLEGLSQEEAARHLGCTVAAIKGRLERGRNQLRQRLEKRGLTLPTVLGGSLLLAGSTSPVPAALAQATLQSVTSGIGATPVIVSLMKGAMRAMLLDKLKLAGAVLVFLSAAGGIGMMALRENQQPPQSPRFAALPLKSPLQGEHKDLYGDPLPKGATMRLGTLQRRAVGARLAVSADGQSIVGVRGKKYLQIWDAATGKLRQTRELPGEGIASPVLSSDGKMLAMAEGSENLTIWDAPTGKRLQTLAFKGMLFIFPLAFSSDGKTIAAVGHPQSSDRPHDDLIRAWDLASGKEIFRKDLHGTNQSYWLAFSPDGQRLLGSFNGSRGTYCCCWDIANERQVWKSNEQFWNSTLNIVFTPDGKVLGSKLHEKSKWQAVDLATGQTIPMEKSPPLDFDNYLGLTPDGRTLLISTAKGVMVWDLVRGQEVRTLSGAGEEVAVMPDGKSIITNNGSLQRWDLATGQPLWTDTFALGHLGEVVSIAFSADGTRLASAATDGSVRLWDTRTGKPLRLWRGHLPGRPHISTEEWEAAKVKFVDITPDGRRILSAASGEHIKLWDAAADKEVGSLTLPRRTQGEGERSIFQVRIGSEGDKAVALFGSVGFASKVAVWDLKTGKLLASHPVEVKQPVDIGEARYSLLAPDGRTWLIPGALVDVMSGQEIAPLEGMKAYPRAAFSRDGALIAGAVPQPRTKNGQKTYPTDDIRIWERATGQIIAHWKSPFLCGLLAFHPSNRFLATSSWDGIHLWDMASGKVLATRQMPELIRSRSAQLSYASCLTLAADGRLATGHPDGTILLWEKLLPASKPESLAAGALETLWADLADTDAAKAWRSVWRMADAPQEALAFLRSRIKPYPTAPAEVTRKLLADLDSDSFEIREAAVKRLQELGPQAEPALRAASSAKPSLEQRRRIEKLLADLAKVQSPPTAEELRQLRALIVLERIGSPEARRLLAEVAKGPESARRTRQARNALMCLP